MTHSRGGLQRVRVAKNPTRTSGLASHSFQRKQYASFTDGLVGAGFASVHAGWDSCVAGLRSYKVTPTRRILRMSGRLMVCGYGWRESNPHLKLGKLTFCH